MAVSGVNKPADRKAQAEVSLSGDVLEKAKSRALSAIALQMTLPGVPCVYYGDEIAMEGFADPSCRRCFDWSKTENNSYMDSVKKWIKLRFSSPAFTEGELEILYTIGRVFAFARYTDSEKYVIIANLGDSYERIRLDAGRLGITHLKSEFEELFSDDGIFFVDINANQVKTYKQ